MCAKFISVANLCHMNNITWSLFVRSHKAMRWRCINMWHNHCLYTTKIVRFSYCMIPVNLHMINAHQAYSYIYHHHLSLDVISGYLKGLFMLSQLWIIVDGLGFNFCIQSITFDMRMIPPYMTLAFSDLISAWSLHQDGWLLGILCWNG